MTSTRRSSRASKPTEFYDPSAKEEASMATVAAAKKPRRSVATAPNPNDTAKNDVFELTGEGDDAAVSASRVPNGMDFHEAEAGSKWDDHNAVITSTSAEKEAAEAKYAIKWRSHGDNGDRLTLDDVNDCFLLPTDKSYKQPKVKRNFFQECFDKDGCNNKRRCANAMSNLSGYIRARIGFVGGAFCFAVYAELVPGSGVWEIVLCCTSLEGSRKNRNGSLKQALGGAIDNLNKMAPGEFREHRKDVNGNTLFKVKRLDVRKESVEEIKKEAKANARVWEAAQARLETLEEVTPKGKGSGYTKGEDMKFYSVTKEGDSAYGTRLVKSLSDLLNGPHRKANKGRGDIGRYHDNGKPIKQNDLPSEVGKPKRITTRKGNSRHGEPIVISTYIVTRITVEEYKSKNHAS